MVNASGALESGADSAGASARVPGRRPVRWRDGLEYALFHGLRFVARALPLDKGLAFGRRLGDCLYALDARHRNIAKQNLALVWKRPVEDAQVRRGARSSFRHLGQVAAEFALMPSTPAGNWDDLIEDLEGADRLQEAAAAGNGIVFVTGHTGNWELLGAGVSARIMRLHCVAQSFYNPLLESFIRRKREGFGQVLLPKKGAVRAAARVLKQGGAVVFLMDQHAGRRAPKLPFLGVPAHTYAAPASLAVRFGAPLVAGFCFRTEEGSSRIRFRGYFEKPIFPDASRPVEKEVLRLTQGANDAISRFIWAHPEQWLWMHRRWR
jgi:KDO2-lipid IV(A) lauroyltransferase